MPSTKRRGHQRDKRVKKTVGQKSRALSQSLYTRRKFPDGKQHREPNTCMTHAHVSHTSVKKELRPARLKSATHELCRANNTLWQHKKTGISPHAV